MSNEFFVRSKGEQADAALHEALLGDDKQIPKKTITPMDDKIYELLYGVKRSSSD